MKKISVVIPINNEEDIILDCINLINTFNPVPDELILVSNGSTDSTEKIVLEAAVTNKNIVLKILSKASIGNAQKVGLAASTSDINILFDADYINEDFYNKAITSTADICIFSKREKESLDKRGLLRKTSTYIFTKLIKVFLKTNINDTHGIKSFSKKIVDKYLPLCGTSDNVFDTEMIIRADRDGHLIEIFPATVQEIRPPRKSIFKRAPKALLELYKLKSRL